MNRSMRSKADKMVSGQSGLVCSVCGIIMLGILHRECLYLSMHCALVSSEK